MSFLVTRPLLLAASLCSIGSAQTVTETYRLMPSVPPPSGSDVFGIRLETHPLPTLKANPAARAGLLEAIQTMPPEIAQYKNLTPARCNLLDYLQG